MAFVWFFAVLNILWRKNNNYPWSSFCRFACRWNAWRVGCHPINVWNMSDGICSICSFSGDYGINVTASAERRKRKMNGVDKQTIIVSSVVGAGMKNNGNKLCIHRIKFTLHTIEQQKEKKSRKGKRQSNTISRDICDKSEQFLFKFNMQIWRVILREYGRISVRYVGSILCVLMRIPSFITIAICSPTINFHFRFNTSRIFGEFIDFRK